MIDLPPLGLLLAFAVVAGAAWLIGRRAGSARTVRLPRDYFVGLDHVLNERFDRAADVFSRMAARDDATEVQLALASLFRRRGEMERAIAIHERLRLRAGAALRDRAAFELALDYFSAGLMDRAERLLEELSASKEYRIVALGHLLRIHEQQGDWANALRIFHELPAAAQSERRSEAAHYLCELAEQALRQGELERARALVRQAGQHDEALPRARLIGARLLEAAGCRAEALEGYLGALETAPGMALEVVPRALALGRELGDAEVLGRLGERLRHTPGMHERQLAWLLAAAVPPGELERLPACTIAVLDGEGTEELPALGRLLGRIGDAGVRYLCEDCGLQSVGWFWRCPKCRTWDSLQPAVFKWAEGTGLGASAARGDSG